MADITTNISDNELENLRNARWLCRTDLYYLCKILNFKDVVPEVHGPLVNILQKFQVPPKSKIYQADIVKPGFIQYVPWLDPYQLAGKRRRLILDPRRGLKTTINCVAHTIQFILNFPWLTFLINQSTGEKAANVMRDIKHPFMHNQVFRQIFPDLVPQKSISSWGNQTSFFAPTEDGRGRFIEKFKLVNRKEPTVTAVSIDQGSAGNHYDVMKFSDIVEDNNSKTPLQLASVIHNFDISKYLLVRPDGWIDVEGTRYHYLDLYGKILDKWEKIKENPKYRDEWDIHVRGCYVKDFGDEKPFHTPDSLKLKDKLTSTGKKISWWPVNIDGSTRFPVEMLAQESLDDPENFSSQMENNPRTDTGGKTTFPFNRKDLWIDRRDFWKIPIAYHTVTVDTAETQSIRSDYSCITTCGWSSSGRCYVHDIRHGKFLVSEIIKHIIEVNKLYKPINVKLEETGFVRGMKTELLREMHLKGDFIPFEFLPRETSISKEDRIMKTLEPVWRNGYITFVDDSDLEKEGKRDLVKINDETKQHFIKEASNFPKFHNDILDTLSDQFSGKEWFGREKARPQDYIGGLYPQPPNTEEHSINRSASEQYFYQNAQQEALDRLMNPEPLFSQTLDPLASRTGGL